MWSIGHGSRREAPDAGRAAAFAQLLAPDQFSVLVGIEAERLVGLRNGNQYLLAVRQLA